MSYTYLQEQGEESSADSFSDIPPSVLSRLSLTVEKSCCNGNEMESSQDSQYGTTFARSTVDPGGDTLTSLRADSPVKTYPQPEKAKESLELDRDCGDKWLGSLARYDPDSRSWKTAQCLLHGGLEEYSETWPRWGMMRDGVCWERNTPVYFTSESECGFMPTIVKTHILEKVSPMEAGQITVSPAGYVQKTSKNGNSGSAPWPLWMLYHGYLPTPKAAEFFMDWPMGWTDLQPLEMDKYQQWRHSHGVHLAE